MMATIREIAALADVSIATVSKVLNGKPGVKKATADNIFRIAETVGYRPNLNARFLKVGTARTIGIIAEDITVFNTPQIVDGIASACERNNYHYILSNLRFNILYPNLPADHPEKESRVRSAVDDMLSKQVEGIIYVGCHSHTVFSLKQYVDIPFVCAYCTCSDLDVPCVIYDDRQAAYEATEELVRGLRGPVGMITGPISSVHSLRRATGFMDALRDSGIPYRDSLVKGGEWDQHCGYTYGAELIRAGAKGIFAQNDLIAIGVNTWCAENGLLAGRDFYLIGFDDREVSAVIRPAISTVSIPLFEIGLTAGEIIMKMLRGEKIECRETLLKCKVVCRESTGGKK